MYFRGIFWPNLSFKLRVEPLLYRVLVISIYYRQEMRGFPVITPEILQRVVATQPPQFLQNHVKHLFLKDLGSSELETVLTACSGVTNLLSYPAYSTHLGALGAMKNLRRIALSIETFLGYCNTASDSSSLPKITHLELLDTSENPSTPQLAACLPLMPRLTHVAFNYISRNDVHLHTALCANTNLRCILVLIKDGWLVDIRSTDFITKDDRFVCLDYVAQFRVDWLRGVATGEDYWAFADVFIARRREGKFPRKYYPHFSLYSQTQGLIVRAGGVWSISHTKNWGRY